MSDFCAFISLFFCIVVSALLINFHSVFKLCALLFQMFPKAALQLCSSWKAFEAAPQLLYSFSRSL